MNEFGSSDLIACLQDSPSISIGGVAVAIVICKNSCFLTWIKFKVVARELSSLRGGRHYPAWEYPLLGRCGWRDGRCHVASASGQTDGDASPIYGIKIPAGYRDWRLISVKQLAGNKHMGLIVTLIVFVGLAAIIVWIADWTSVAGRPSTALDILNRRLARGEIDRAEYDEKRKLIGR
jgi:uncharacterized membrane protein